MRTLCSTVFLRYWTSALAAVCLLAVTAAAAGRIEPAQPRPAKAVEVGESLRPLIEADWIDRERRFGKPAAAAPGQAAPPVTTAEDAAGGCDGVKNGSQAFSVPGSGRATGSVMRR